ncbi:MAG TPA: DUF4190 domain-containing protein [Thermoanaerobaculia bacterium]|nr:DUF4190 domain-containing protein [Thermoanaerobaculia bacterium]
MAIPSEPQAQQQSASTQAVIALILGILGVIPCCHIFAPVAWFLGATERTAIREGRSPKAGEGFATAGMILGIIGTCLLIFGLLWLFFWGGMAVLSHHWPR